ncbi:MAG: ABC transporter permease [Alphaproteobacteria bacterium]|nr:ABC transporter permease [Alphaproteobacteria bacterium]
MTAANQTGESAPRRQSDALGGVRLNKRQRQLLAFGAVIGAIAVWWLLSATGLVNPILLPTPFEVADSFVRLTLDGTLPAHVLASLLRVVQGFLLALVIALPIGVAMGMSQITRGVVEPLVELIRPIPPIAVIPLAILWFGTEEFSKVFIIMFGAFFPILVNTMAGFSDVDPVHIRAAQTLGANRFQIFRDVIIRSAFPYIVVGARLGMGLAFIVLVAAELIASSEGLGYLINDARYRFQTSEIFLGMACIGVLGFLLNRLLLEVERRLLRWRQEPPQ